jgi:hypothetical protein
VIAAARMPDAMFVGLPNLDYVGFFFHSEITLPYNDAFLKVTAG